MQAKNLIIKAGYEAKRTLNDIYSDAYSKTLARYILSLIEYIQKGEEID